MEAENVISHYEILYEDLEDLDFFIFLKSRTFKSFMTKINEYVFWKDRLNALVNSNTLASYDVDFDSEEWYLKVTFTSYLNEAYNSKGTENLITKIICEFINKTNRKVSFDNLLESVQLSLFKKENFKEIENAIIDFRNKNFSQEQINVIESISEERVLTSENKVFIVHGHNEALKQTVARILEKQNLNPIILNEQVDNGLTIIEKLEKFSDVSFAIVLLTADDLGHIKGSEIGNKRARQNVILELGYFFAKLKRKNVLALYEEGVELPSDFAGILYTVIDQEGHWKYKMGKELKAAGFDFDLNNL